MSYNIEVGKVYKHYKNQQLYKVLAIAKHSENNEDMVVYVALYGNGQIWARPLSMWNEEISLNEHKVRRFSKVEE